MRVGLMVEGQNGLTWERWIHILKTAERLGLPSVFRSDHYFIGGHQDSLEAYLSFAVAARETSSIRFGPLVNPITFRSPVDVGRMAAQVDRLSNGRFILGLGAGWHQPEHDGYGIPFPPTRERFDRLEEGVQVIKALWGPGPASYEGKHYRIQDVDCLPKPTFGSDTPLLIGGKGEKRTLPLVAKYADEWNCVSEPPSGYAHKVNVLEACCEEEGRDPRSIRRSMMVFGLIGRDERMLDRMTGYVMGMRGATGSPREFRNQMAAERNFMVGQTQEVVDTLGALVELGLEEVQFQHFNYASDEVPSYLAEEIAPKVASL